MLLKVKEKQALESSLKKYSEFGETEIIEGRIFFSFFLLLFITLIVGLNTSLSGVSDDLDNSSINEFLNTVIVRGKSPEKITMSTSIPSTNHNCNYCITFS